MDKYTYRVTWMEEDGEYVALCAEFPSLSWLDKDQGKALKGIVKLVSGVLKEMQDSGEPLPVPLSIKNFTGKFMVRITPDMHRGLAIEAAEQKISLNRLVSSRLSKEVY